MLRHTAIFLASSKLQWPIIIPVVKRQKKGVGNLGWEDQPNANLTKTNTSPTFSKPIHPSLEPKPETTTRNDQAKRSISTKPATLTGKTTCTQFTQYTRIPGVLKLVEALASTPKAHTITKAFYPPSSSSFNNHRPSPITHHASPTTPYNPSSRHPSFINHQSSPVIHQAPSSNTHRQPHMTRRINHTTRNHRYQPLSTT